MNMDRIILNILSLLVAGAGVFSALTKFYVPELDASFIGHNPFAIKANAIDDVTTKIFVGLGIIGLLLEAGTLIFGDQLPEAVHSRCFYMMVFLAGLCISLVSIWGLKNVGYHLSRQVWFPKIVESQMQIYNDARSILDHDGWQQDQLKNKDKLTDPEKYRLANFEQVEDHIGQIEKLLDVKSERGELQDRLRNLEKYFHK